MTTGRVTQTGLEVVRQEDQVDARVTQTGLEVVRQEDSLKARVTQTGLEVIRQEDSVKALITQVGIEVVRANENEVPPAVRIDQAALEVVQTQQSSIRADQAALEIIRENKKTPGKGKPGTPASGNNVAITPPIPPDTVQGDLVAVAVYGRQTSGSLSISAGWTNIIHDIDSSGALGVWFRIYQNGDGDPTITPNGASDGDTIIGQCGVWSNIDQINAFDRIISGDVSSNTSQQNIGPITGDAASDAGAAGQVIIVVGGKSDQWTSVDNLENFARLGEPTSALGNSAGLVWDFLVIDQATQGAISDKTFVVTGGSSAVGKGVQLLFNGVVNFLELDASIQGAASTTAEVELVNSGGEEAFSSSDFYRPIPEAKPQIWNNRGFAESRQPTTAQRSSAHGTQKLPGAALSSQTQSSQGRGKVIDTELEQFFTILAVSDDSDKD